MGVSSTYIREVDFNLSSLTDLTARDPKFTRTGYTFQHWKDKDGLTYEDQKLVNFNLAEVNLSAVWKINKYTVTWGTPANGSITVKVNETTITSGTEVDYKTTLTITATPDAGYKLNTLKVNGEDFVSGSTYTVGTSNVTIAATFNDNTGTITYWPGY